MSDWFVDTITPLCRFELYSFMIVYSAGSLQIIQFSIVCYVSATTVPLQSSSLKHFAQGNYCSIIGKQWETGYSQVYSRRSCKLFKNNLYTDCYPWYILKSQCNSNFEKRDGFKVVLHNQTFRATFRATALR